MSSRGRPRRQARLRWPSRRRRWLIYALVAVALPAAAIAGFLMLSGGSDAPRVLIIDQLSLTQPNPEFEQQARAILEPAGFAVDYIPGEDASVDLYRQLPSYGYELILWRAHAGRLVGEDGELTDETYLFTSETYTPEKYVRDQVEGRLKLVAYDDVAADAGEFFFGIPGDFVADAMEGDFGGAKVILMGCDIFRAEHMARSFVERGAGAVVGWDRPVSAAHTDAVTLNLIQRFVDGETSAQAAAAATMEELGPDPFYDAELLAYPAEG